MQLCFVIFLDLSFLIVESSFQYFQYKGYLYFLAPGPGTVPRPQFVFDNHGSSLYLAPVLNLYLPALEYIFIAYIMQLCFVIYRLYRLVRVGNNKSQRLHIKLLFLFFLCNGSWLLFVVIILILGCCSLSIYYHLVTSYLFQKQPPEMFYKKSCS